MASTVGQESTPAADPRTTTSDAGVTGTRSAPKLVVDAPEVPSVPVGGAGRAVGHVRALGDAGSDGPVETTGDAAAAGTRSPRWTPQDLAAGGESSSRDALGSAPPGSPTDAVSRGTTESPAGSVTGAGHGVAVASESASSPASAQDEGSAASLVQVDDATESRSTDTASDDTASESTASDGTASDGTAPEGTASDGTASEGTAVNAPDAPDAPDASDGSGPKPRRSGRPQPVSVVQMAASSPWRASDGEPSAPAIESDGPVADPTGASGEGAPSAPSSELPPMADDEAGSVADLPDQRRSAADAAVADGHDDAQRAALVESLPQPTPDTPLLAELQIDARRRIELRGRKFPRPERTRVITVANQKGGVGKTTTTVNLAAALAQAGLQVLVLDNDPQGNASTALGIDHRAGTPSIYEVLVDGAPMHEAVQESPDVPGLWCLPATIDLSGAEIELVSMVARETRLRTALDAYLDWRAQQGLGAIDYVFVDCPPSLGLLTVNAFVVAREVLIPIQCEYYALEGLSQLLKTIELIQAHLNPGLAVSTILLTMYDARTNLAQQVAEEVRTHFPERTLRTTVPRSVRISEAPSYGQTVMTYDGGSSGALAYLEAARELAERGVPTTTPTTAGTPGGPVQEDQ